MKNKDYNVKKQKRGYVARYTLYKQDGSKIHTKAIRETLKELDEIKEKLKLLGVLDNSITQVHIIRKIVAEEYEEENNEDNSCGVIITRKNADNSYDDFKVKLEHFLSY